jgi:hypothetical protein
VQWFLQDITFSQCLTLRGYDLEVSCICFATVEKKNGPSAVYASSFNQRRLGPLFLLDRLELCVVDLFSGNEQVEPGVEFF